MSYDKLSNKVKSSYPLMSSGYVFQNTIHETLDEYRPRKYKFGFKSIYIYLSLLSLFRSEGVL